MRSCGRRRLRCRRRPWCRRWAGVRWRAGRRRAGRKWRRWRVGWRWRAVASLIGAAVDAISLRALRTERRVASSAQAAPRVGGKAIFELAASHRVRVAPLCARAHAVGRRARRVGTQGSTARGAVRVLARIFSAPRRTAGRRGDRASALGVVAPNAVCDIARLISAPSGAARDGGCALGVLTAGAVDDVACLLAAPCLTPRDVRACCGCRRLRQALGVIAIRAIGNAAMVWRHAPRLTPWSAVDTLWIVTR